MPPKVALRIGEGIVRKLPQGETRQAVEEEVERGRRLTAIRGAMRAGERRGEITRVNIPKKKRHRIGGFQYAAMLGVAMFFDFLQLILTFLIIGLIINTILSVVIFLFFFAWFSANGVNYFTGPHVGRRFTTMSATFLAKLIPGVNMLPLWTIRIWRETRLVHQEDKEYNERKPKLVAA